MLTEQLWVELEDILNEYNPDKEWVKTRGPGETSPKMVALRAKRHRAITKKYPVRGTPSGKVLRHDPESGYKVSPSRRIGKRLVQKIEYPTDVEKKKWEAKKSRKFDVSPDEKSALSKALKHIGKTKKRSEPGKVIPFRARKAA